MKFSNTFTAVFMMMLLAFTIMPQQSNAQVLSQKQVVFGASALLPAASFSDVVPSVGVVVIDNLLLSVEASGIEIDRDNNQADFSSVNWAANLRYYAISNFYAQASYGGAITSEEDQIQYGAQLGYSLPIGSFLLIDVGLNWDFNDFAEINTQEWGIVFGANLLLN